MPNYLVIDGIKYELVPVPQPKEEKREEKGSILDGYVAEEGPIKEREAIKEAPTTGEVKKAVGKVSDYRERFKKRQITLADVKVMPQFRANLPKMDAELDKFTYGGEKLFFGKGLSADW